MRIERVFGSEDSVPRWIATLSKLLPREDEVRLVCLVLLLGVIAVNAGSWVTGFLTGKTLDGRPAGADFIAFYNGGRILNEFGGERLYDLGLQDNLYKEAHPWHRDHTMWYVNAPFLAQAFRPLATLPYAWACVVWSILSALFYAAAGALVWPRGLSSRWLSAPVLTVASFPAFAVDAWTGGQLSSLTALVLAAAFRLYRERKFAWSGAVLALSLYKPTIALPLAGFLLIAGELRVIAGYVLGAATVGLVSLATVGFSGLRAFVDTMRMYSRFTSSGQNPLTVEYKCIDLNHFMRSLAGGNATMGFALFVLLAAAAFLFIVIEWRKAKAAGAGEAMWAVGITSALLLNLYVPLYDATLLAVSGLITAGTLLKTSAPALRRALSSVSLLVYIGVLVATPLGRIAGIQMYTLIVLMFALFQVAAARASAPVQESVPAAAAR